MEDGRSPLSASTSAALEGGAEMPSLPSVGQRASVEAGEDHPSGEAEHEVAMTEQEGVALLPRMKVYLCG